jgi:hypothetical protein
MESGAVRIMPPAGAGTAPSSWSFYGGVRQVIGIAGVPSPGAVLKVTTRLISWLFPPSNCNSLHRFFSLLDFRGIYSSYECIIHGSESFSGTTGRAYMCLVENIEHLGMDNSALYSGKAARRAEHQNQGADRLFFFFFPQDKHVTSWSTI